MTATPARRVRSNAHLAVVSARPGDIIEVVPDDPNIERLIKAGLLTPYNDVSEPQVEDLDDHTNEDSESSSGDTGDGDSPIRDHPALNASTEDWIEWADYVHLPLREDPSRGEIIEQAQYEGLVDPE